MGEFAVRVLHFLSRPEDVIYAVASALLYPVLFIEVAALLYVAYETGAFTIEAVQRHRARKRLHLMEAVKEIVALRGTSEAGKAVRVLRRFEYGPIVGPVAKALVDDGVTKAGVLKLLGDAERAAMRRLDRTRAFIRLGPILGLMGTLIPISPALVGLAQGDTQTLSANLVVAFSTTVVGLLIGSFGYLVSLGRERIYAQDMADLEFVLEHLGARR